MLFTLLGAMAKKHWQAATTDATPIPHTTTPITNLTQRSAVDFGAASIPLILAQGNGSIIQAVADRNMIYAIGTLRYLGHTIYRAYLSQSEGAFLHIAVADSKPTEVLEFRLYQPYTEFVPLWQTPEDAAAKGVPQPDMALVWSTWLLDNPDPQIGGLIGCPTFYGKPTDLDPSTDPQTPYLYHRTWTPGDGRVQPVTTIEQVLDGDGGTIRIEHDMMSYARPLKDATKFEYLMVSAASGPDGASVVYWLGVDMTPTDLTVYPPATPG